MSILRHSCSPVKDGILHNTPALHHSSTPIKINATADPSLSDPRNAGSSTGPSLIPLSCAGQRSRGLVRGEDQVSKSEWIMMDDKLTPDPELLLKIARMRMPFGKYKDRLLIDLPESYIVWFSQKGFPEGQLGEMLRIVYEVKLNGLEYLFKSLRTR